MLAEIVCVVCGVILLGTSVPAGADEGAAAGADSRPLLKLREVPFTQVRIQDHFWTPRRDANREVSLPHSLDMLEEAGNVGDFELAAAHARSGYRGPVFMDSDLYKVLEACSYSLATNPDPVLERRVDAMIAKVAAAQMPDGYLDTYYEVNSPDRRWTNLRDHHELYCAGHLIEAAVAHFKATGKRTLLDVAIRVADHIAARFGDGPGQHMGYPGHPQIEQALVKLYRVTGSKRYFDLARFFIDHRGSHYFAVEHDTPPDRYDGAYWQDDVPIRDRTVIAGHAVRAGYLLSGVVDVAGETDDAALLQMVDRVWRNTMQKRVYLTGGIGPSASNEGFTTDYDLPNLTAYQETCASVAMVMWSHRLNLLYGDAKYADEMETALYNGMLAGVSLDGKHFFYVNPLSSAGGHHRVGWFSCACCPPNEARTLAALGEYAYATGRDSLWVSLYIAGGMHTEVDGHPLRLDVATDYPWDGDVRLTVHPDSARRFALRLRVPGWCEGATVSVDGAPVIDAPVERGYIVLDRTWRPGATVDLRLPMPPRRIEANPNVLADRGRLALARGPLVYCVEQADVDAPVSQIAVPATAAVRAVRKPDMLGGIVALETTGETAGDEEWSGALYRAAQPPKSVPVAAIPYYAWDNRAPGEMEVWMPTAPPVPPAGGPERAAKVTLSYVSDNCQPWGVNDGIEPKSSGEQPAALCHWWPHKGTEEWAQYTWTKPIDATGVRVYWFDDTGRGECRIPAAWRVEYRDGDTWKPVLASQHYAVALDRWIDVTFTPVKTTALRLVVQLQPGWAAGVRQWRVESED